MVFTREGEQVEFKMSLQLKPPGEERDAAKIAFDSDATRWNRGGRDPIDIAWHGRVILYDSVRYRVASVKTSCSKRPVICDRVGGGLGLKVPPSLLRKLIAGEHVTKAVASSADDF